MISPKIFINHFNQVVQPIFLINTWYILSLKFSQAFFSNPLTWLKVYSNGHLFQRFFRPKSFTPKGLLQRLKGFISKVHSQKFVHGGVEAMYLALIFFKKKIKKIIWYLLAVVSPWSGEIASSVLDSGHAKNQNIKSLYLSKQVNISWISIYPNLGSSSLQT